MNVLVSGLPLLVVHEVLEQSAADSLHRAAGDLAFDDRGVDHHAAVLADDVAQQRDGAGVRIDLDRAEVACVREHEQLVGRVAVQDLQARFHARRQTAGLEVRGVRDLGDGARSRGCAAHARDAVDDVDVVGRGLQQVGGDLRHLCSEAPAPRPGSRRRGSAHSGSRRCRTRTASRWCRPGAPSTSSNATPRNSLTSCAVVVSRPWPCDPEPRYTSTVPSGWTRRCAGSVLYGPIMLCGSMYRPMPTPRRRPTANCSRCQTRNAS